MLKEIKIQLQCPCVLLTTVVSIPAYHDSGITRRITEPRWICRYRLEGAKCWLLNKMGFMSSSSAAPMPESCHKVVLVPRLLAVPSQPTVWGKQGSREGCIHIFHLLAIPGHPSTENMPCASCEALDQMKILVSLSQIQGVQPCLEWVGINPMCKKDHHMNNESQIQAGRTNCPLYEIQIRHGIHATVKEVNWPFWELCCMTLIPWTTRHAFSRYTLPCQLSLVLMYSTSLHLVQGNWRAEPLIQGWILSTVNEAEGGTGRYGCSSPAFHGFYMWALLYWYCWKDIWLQKAASIYLQAPLHQVKLVL